MKQKILALLLCLSLLAAMAPMALAAEATPQLSLETQWDQGEALVILSVKDAASASNGRIILGVPESAEPRAAKLLAPVGAYSLNDEISISWVGSDFAEDQPLLELHFGINDDLTVTAQAVELYAGETALSAEPAEALLTYAPFLDVEGHWAEEEILKAYHHGLILGMDALHFQPDGTLTRAQLVTMLYRMAGSPAVSGPSSFQDVEPREYYADAVAWAEENEISNGIGDGLFAPSKVLTRQEFAAFLYRFAKPETVGDGDLSQFVDAEKVADWAVEPFSWAVANELIIGFPGNRLCPTGKTVRAQAAVVLCRYLEL